MLPGLDATLYPASHPNHVRLDRPADQSGLRHDHRTGQVELALHNALHLNYALAPKRSLEGHALSNNSAAGPGQRGFLLKVLLGGGRRFYPLLRFLHTKKAHMNPHLSFGTAFNPLALL